MMRHREKEIQEVRERILVNLQKYDRKGKLVNTADQFFRKMKEEYATLDEVWTWDLIDIVKAFARNVRNKKQEEDIEAMVAIFQEFAGIYQQMKALDVEGTTIYFYSKLYCINAIVDRNIFQNYTNLQKVIQVVNREWGDITINRGFSIDVFWDFCRAMEFYEKNGQPKTEDEKKDLFLGLLDGTMKFVPQYVLKAENYRIEPADYEEKEKSVVSMQTKYDEGYQLISK